MTPKNKKPKWDGLSRISNELYRKNFEKIFGKASPEEEEVYKKWEDPDNEDYE